VAGARSRGRETTAAAAAGELSAKGISICSLPTINIPNTKFKKKKTQNTLNPLAISLRSSFMLGQD